MGLNYLHNNCIAHRDLNVIHFISPDLLISVQSKNILVILANLNCVKSLHVTDFGVSQKFSSTKNLVHGLAGTPGFIAPEAFGEQDYSPFCADSNYLLDIR